MERKRARTVLSKKAYEAIGDAANAPHPKPWAPQSVEFVHKNAQRMLQFFFPTKADELVAVSLPIGWIDELEGATLGNLRTARLSPSHTAVIVDGVEAFISVEGLFRDFGEKSPAIKALMIHSFAATGGKKTSEAKRLSSAENGKKGGRPAKKKPDHALAARVETL